jgi:hypothetical protein
MSSQVTGCITREAAWWYIANVLFAADLVLQGGGDVKFLPHRLYVGGLIKDLLGPLIQTFS